MDGRRGRGTCVSRHTRRMYTTRTGKIPMIPDGRTTVPQTVGSKSWIVHQVGYCHRIIESIYIAGSGSLQWSVGRWVDGSMREISGSVRNPEP